MTFCILDPIHAALGIVTAIEGALPNNFVLRGTAVNFGVPWISISISFNVLVTAIIASRLMYAHHKMRFIVSPAENQTYTGATAILVESALPLAVIGIVFAVFYAKSSPAAIAFSAVWGSFVVSYLQA